MYVSLTSVVHYTVIHTGIISRIYHGRLVPADSYRLLLPYFFKRDFVTGGAPFFEQEQLWNLETVML